MLWLGARFLYSYLLKRLNCWEVVIKKKKIESQTSGLFFQSSNSKNACDLKKENLAFSCLIWWSNHIGNLRGGRSGIARWFYFDTCPSNVHRGNAGCYMCVWSTGQLRERQSGKLSKLLVPLKSPIFRIKLFDRHFVHTLNSGDITNPIRKT